MSIKDWCFGVGCLAWALAASPCQATEAADADARCQALGRADFSLIADAPTQIGEAKSVSDVGQLFEGIAHFFPDAVTQQARRNTPSIQPYCRVFGYVMPNVGFELLLPLDHWNGRILHVGCAGWCGSTGLVGVVCAQHPGYACVGTDMGHTGSGGLWFRGNAQAQIDFSYRATHVTTLAGKAITEQYYSRKPERAYFLGCSTGGYQGMMEAQRFPWDFDGIVAGAPDMDESDLAVRGIWIKQNFQKAALTADLIQRLHAAALAACDMDDGVKDGLISDPAHCAFDPKAIECKDGETRGCLSAAQVQAVRNIYGVPVNSKGIAVSSRGVFPGSENFWTQMFTHTWGDEYFKDTALLDSRAGEWNSDQFDFDRDAPRAGTGVLFADTNPDLRKFKAAGGKLITYQGGNDAAEIPGAIVDYYETVEKTLGGRSTTQDFFRLFMIPGMNHCTEGDGVYAFDYLGYLVAWVERGQAPNVMVGTRVKNLPEFGSFGLKVPLDPAIPVAFTRPVYPYPAYAKYTGAGDPNRAENFKPVLPPGAR